jgi:uncharacterized protein YbjT (DUF2867 family)
MDQGLVVVFGASGQVGGRLTELLLEGRRKVRVVARRAEALARFAQAGAEMVTGSLADAEFTGRALAGAQAAFVLIPPMFVEADLRGHQNRVSEAIVAGLRGSSVSAVVNLSSWGAEVPYGTGPIAGLHDHEERLDRLENVRVVHLRPGSFMENFLTAAGMIRHQGALMGTLRGDLPIPMIATRDIAQEAWRLLAALDFDDKSTRELLGPRGYTMTEAAGILGHAVGRADLPYVVLPDQQMHHALASAGLPGHMIDMLLEMYRAIDAGKIHAAEPRLPENTTSTTLEDWAADTFAAAYRATQ